MVQEESLDLEVQQHEAGQTNALKQREKAC